MGLFPVFDVPRMIEPNKEPNNKMKESIYFDFQKGDFVLDDGGMLQTATPYDTWVQWCLKTIYTQRWSCLAYSDQVGIEMEEAFSQSDRQSQQRYLETTIRDALLSDPYKRTKRVYDFDFDWGADILHVTFVVEGIWKQSATLTVVY